MLVGRRDNRNIRISRTGLLAMPVIIMALSLSSVAVYGQSGSVLRRRLSAAEKRAEDAKERVAQERKEARRAKNELVDAQKHLAAAEARLKRARTKLQKTRTELDVIRKKLAKAEKRLGRHSAAMKKRMLTLFRSHQPSYAEVLLHSTSFTDFANRTRYVRMLCEYDQQVLNTLVEDRQQVEAQRAKLAQKQAKLKKLEAKTEREKRVVAERAAEAKRLRHNALEDVDAAEHQYEQMQQTAREIGARLRRLQGSGSSLAHSGSFSGRLRRPTAGPITSEFGTRVHPILHTRRFHNGIDIAAPGGTAIRSAEDGTVIFAGWKSAYGLTVIVDHGSGISTMYAHCQRGSVRVRTGQEVSRGQTLARIDSTGWSTGNHLHWTVFKNGNPVNPTGYY